MPSQCIILSHSGNTICMPLSWMETFDDIRAEGEIFVLTIISIASHSGFPPSGYVYTMQPLNPVSIDIILIHLQDLLDLSVFISQSPNDDDVQFAFIPTRVYCHHFMIRKESLISNSTSAILIVLIRVNSNMQTVRKMISKCPVSKSQ